MSHISIITTTYDHQDFIAQTIEAILNQNNTDRELLIGDDSPGNETRNIIQSYIKKHPERIRARHHNPNKGIVENTKFLLSQVSSESEYVAFLEGDDLYTVDNLSRKIDIFVRYPNLAIVYSDLSFIDRDNNIILKSFFSQRNIKYYQNSIIPIDEYISAGAGPICSRSTGMFRKEILNHYQICNILPEKKAYAVSDRDIYFQISTKHLVYGIQEPLTQYRRHSNNLSGTSGGGTSEDLELLISYYHKRGWIDTNLLNLKMSWINIVHVIFAIENKQYQKARFYWFKSFHKNGYAFVLRKVVLLGLLVIPMTRSSAILKRLIKRG